MIQYLKCDNGFKETEQYDFSCWINVVNPTKDDINELVSHFNTPDYFYEDISDIDERPRFDRDDGWILTIIRVPNRVRTEDNQDPIYTTIPLGTSFHKDGSIIGSVFKIMFLVYLFGMDVSIIKVLGVSLLATILITAVPIGGGTISEMLIISLMGFPIASLPILTIIATIIDAPATVLNVVGDSASSMLVAKIVDGKNWIIKKSS